MKIKAVSVKQPWAGLIAAGIKTIELRVWTPGPKGEIYTGPLCIVSSLKPDKSGFGSLDGPTADAIEPYLLFGQAICVCRLVGCRVMARSDVPVALRPFDARLWAWVLTNPKPLTDPFSVKGRLGLYEVEVPDHEIM
jgi:hypothetical protein